MGNPVTVADWRAAVDLAAAGLVDLLSGTSRLAGGNPVLVLWGIPTTVAGRRAAVDLAPAGLVDLLSGTSRLIGTAPARVLWGAR